MKFFKKAKRGFTLVELVVVIAVIAILAAVSVGAYFGVTESANNSKLEQETKQMYTAIQTIALGTSSNQSLGKDGLTVADIDKFETELEASTGQEYEVLTSKPNLLSRTTIVLQTGEFQAVNGASILYKTFEYYNPEISGKKVIASTINGDFKIEKIDSIPVDYGAEDVTNNLVHVVNEAGWSDVYVYAWRESDEVKNANWPGVPMVNLGGNIYAYYLTSTFDKVIFNNNSGAQTPDLDVPTGDEPNYYNNSTKAWGDEPSSDVIVPEIQYKDIYYASYWENPKIHAWAEDTSLGYFDKEMELVSGNLYKVEVPVTYDKGLIFRDSTEKLQTSDILFTGYDAESKVLWNGTEWTTTSNLPTFEIKTMYAILSDEYTTPYIHTWGNDSRYKLNWPGLAMVKVENNDYNIWSYSFVDAPTNMKINNNNADPQTGDLSFAWTAEKPYYDLAQNAWISVPGETAEGGEEVDPNPGTPVEITAVYLRPNQNWLQASARFAIYAWDSNGNTWIDMSDSNADGIYEVEIPNNYNDFKFIRMNPNVSDNRWNNNSDTDDTKPVWNQTDNLIVPENENNTFVIPKGEWDNTANDSNYWMTLSQAVEYEYPADPIVEERIIYFEANEKDDDPTAYFEAWVWGGTIENYWVKFELDSSKNLWKATINTGNTGMKILRKGPQHTSEDWSSWNETGDITIPSDKNCVVWTQGTWDGNAIEWKTV